VVKFWYFNPEKSWNTVGTSGFAGFAAAAGECRYWSTEGQWLKIRTAIGPLKANGHKPTGFPSPNRLL